MKGGDLKTLGSQVKEGDLQTLGSQVKGGDLQTLGSIWNKWKINYF